MQDGTADRHQAAQAARAAWLRVLVLAAPAALEQAVGRLGALPAYRLLRKPESGMAMVRGRAGGTGAQFNLGEVSVTRCAVTLDAGVVGVGYVQGRAHRQAEQIALLDALLQLPEWHQRVHTEVVAPLAQARAASARQEAAVAAQTKVEFFTMVRGED
ncbi:phosphonate C-P lyase system protein PhnG [Cupriavidus basilensis]|uniref:Phosphonate C-P lyase system protein PhnG n=1 Tax=Cupriavidus basilensis TaxID=68895 RepID=A0ABT6AX47_9BURK|nr:phosphonate C-P lyase system protein PhnG [Cupriavidus basilensis]MDF3837190.1 phosphonate C-P lyase system protein PhnG [Cupriavidus basilensis]